MRAGMSVDVGAMVWLVLILCSGLVSDGISGARFFGFHHGGWRQSPFPDECATSFRNGFPAYSALFRDAGHDSFFVEDAAADGHYFGFELRVGGKHNLTENVDDAARCSLRGSRQVIGEAGSQESGEENRRREFLLQFRQGARCLIYFIRGVKNGGADGCDICKRSQRCALSIAMREPAGDEADGQRGD